MQVGDVVTSGPLVQVIDVLCDDLRVEILFQTGQCTVSCIRLNRQQLLATYVVKADDRFPIPDQGLRCAYIFDAVFIPQSVRIPKGRQTAVGTHSCSGEDYEFFLLVHDDRFLIFN